MKLEQITVTRELCILLKRFGYPQEESLFYRFKGDHKVYDGRNINKSGRSFESMYYAAPVDAEIDAMLPAEYVKGTGLYLTVTKKRDLHFATYRSEEKKIKEIVCDKSPQNAKARLYVKLKQKGLIK